MAKLRTKRALIVPAIAGMLLCSATRRTHGAEAGDDAGETPAAAVAKAGREVVDAMKQRIKAGEPLTPAFMTTFAEWSRRGCLAELAATRDAALREKAVTDHLANATFLKEVIDNREADRDVPHVLVVQVRYYVAEAKLWIEKVKAGKAIVSE